MANIGYAVFGRPKGLKTIANGLFSDLGIESTLYLADADVILQPGEKVLLIKRIPTDLGNRDKRDGILIALYEHAYQHIENRAGGFIGSAICFKEFNPNSGRLIKGLYALFIDIKKQVDENGRFRRSDATEWNIELPNADKDYGFLTSSKLHYEPIKKSVNKLVIPVQDMEQYGVGVLDNSAVNWSFHAVNNFYITDKQSVLETIKAKGGSVFDYDELFNYSDQMRLIQEDLDSRLELVNEADRKNNKLEREAKEKQNAIQQLSQSIESKKKQESALLEKVAFQEKEIQRIKKESENWIEQERGHQKKIKELEKEKSRLEGLIRGLNRDAKRTEEKGKNPYDHQSIGKRKTGAHKNKNKEPVFSNKKHQLNMPLVIATGVALLMTILVIFLLLDRYSENDKIDPSNIVGITAVDSLVMNNDLVFINLWNVDSVEFFEDVYERNINSLKLAEGLDSIELESLRKSPSLVYSTYSDNNNVINFLNNRYLIPVENNAIGVGNIEFKDDMKNLANPIPDLFEAYNSSPDINSIYDMIPKDKGINTNILRKHFEWMITTNNSPDWRENNTTTSIQVPIIK